MYYFKIGGIEVKCDTLAELKVALSGKSVKVEPIDSTEAGALLAAKPKRSTGSGPAASWEAARKLAKKEGISPQEARLKIAAEKRAALKAATAKLEK